MEKFRPTPGHVLVRPLAPQKQETSKLDLGGSPSQEQVLRGEIVGTPSWTKNPITVGTIILLDYYAGKEHRIDGELLRILAEDDILGILEVLE